MWQVQEGVRMGHKGWKKKHLLGRVGVNGAEDVLVTSIQGAGIGCVRGNVDK